MTPTPSPTFRIVHATAFGAAEQVVFEHAVALARDAKAKLYAVHACTDANAICEDDAPPPSAQAVLMSWLSHQGDAGEVGLDEGDVAETVDYHVYTQRGYDDPVEGVLKPLGLLEPDLLITGTHQRSGVWRLLHDSVAEALALANPAPTLLIPLGQPGFVDADSGAVSVERVLLPAQDYATASYAMDQLKRLARALGWGPLDVTLVHIGPAPDEAKAPLVVNDTRWRVRWRHRNADDVHSQLLKTAQEEGPDLIVMATHGHDSTMDTLLGSHTERIIREAPCPVLSLPLPQT